MLSESTPMNVDAGHLLGQMGFRDVLESDERLIKSLPSPWQTHQTARLRGRSPRLVA